MQTLLSKGAAACCGLVMLFCASRAQCQPTTSSVVVIRKLPPGLTEAALRSILAAGTQQAQDSLRVLGALRKRQGDSVTKALSAEFATLRSLLSKDPNYVDPSALIAKVRKFGLSAREQTKQIRAGLAKDSAAIESARVKANFDVAAIRNKLHSSGISFAPTDLFGFNQLTSIRPILHTKSASSPPPLPGDTTISLTFASHRNDNDADGTTMEVDDSKAEMYLDYSVSQLASQSSCITAVTQTFTIPNNVPSVDVSVSLSPDISTYQGGVGVVGASCSFGLSLVRNDGVEYPLSLRRPDSPGDVMSIDGNSDYYSTLMTAAPLTVHLPASGSRTYSIKARLQGDAYAYGFCWAGVVSSSDLGTAVLHYHR